VYRNAAFLVTNPLVHRAVARQVYIAWRKISVSFVYPQQSWGYPHSAHLCVITTNTEICFWVTRVPSWRSSFIVKRSVQCENHVGRTTFGALYIRSYTTLIYTSRSNNAYTHQWSKPRLFILHEARDYVPD
jgi:hypothetical protein